MEMRESKRDHRHLRHQHTSRGWIVYLGLKLRSENLTEQLATGIYGLAMNGSNSASGNSSPA